MPVVYKLQCESSYFKVELTPRHATTYIDCNLKPKRQLIIKMGKRNLCILKVEVLVVILFCIMALVSSQNASQVMATYHSYKPQEHNWDLNAVGAFCASQDANKSFAWRSKFGWTAWADDSTSAQQQYELSGSVPCGDCLKVTNTENGTQTSQIVRIVDHCTSCSSGALELDIDVFQNLDSFGTGMANGYLTVDYQFVNCEKNHNSSPSTVVANVTEKNHNSSPSTVVANVTEKNHNSSSRTILPNVTAFSPTPTPTPTPTLISPSPLLYPNQFNHDTNTNTGSHFTWKRKLIIGVGSAMIAALLMCIIIYCFRSKIFTRHVRLQLRTKNDKNIEAFLKNHGALAQKRYKFLEVKKMTNSFKVKLGEGGFGAVYKGKLLNGTPVAVKILSASKGNGEDFINEVSSISRTSHINVVTLLGFCFEGRKKALIYEFMTNGSLDKFIYNKGPGTIASLSWDNLDQIAKGIARGLEYLHRGCTTRILHFDIKPHNILLDEFFCPKISDFGLAKLCPKKESIISMSDARGTTGYVAPEVWNRQFGGVSHKSDVYSYGMMLLEMVGGRKNINAEASHTSEIYYPYWVYTRLQLGSDLRPDDGVMMVTEEDEIARRMTIVGLWCIQTFPNDRPTMSKVIEMLESNMNSLEIPPKPLFSSPTRSESNSPTS